MNWRISCKLWFHLLRNAPKDSALYQAWGNVLPPKYPQGGVRYEVTEGGIPVQMTPLAPAPAYRAVPFNGLRDMGDWRYFCVTGQWKSVPWLWGWNTGVVVAWGRLPEDWFDRT